jgi:acyl-CoA synthetase (AMP-forming)/AMP-acid ligase II/acyl carrier protein
MEAAQVPAPQVHIAALLREQAERRGCQPAILSDEGTFVSYAALAQQTDRTRIELGDFGLTASDTIALVLPDGPEAAVAFLSTAGAATCAPLNPAYRASELAFYLEDLQARAVVVPVGGAPDARAVARDKGIAILELVPDSAAPGLFGLRGSPRDARHRAEEPASPDSVALVLHTSGTTARPKIVPLSHANLCLSARHVADALALDPMDRCLNVMPLFHVHGLIGALLSTLSAGGSIVCAPGFQAAHFLDWVQRLSPTWYTAVPTMHQAILGRAAAKAPFPLRTTLRAIRSCSAALPPTTMAELERAFGVPVIEAYGMTEAAHQIASNPLPPRRRKPGSVGLPAGPDVAVLGATGELLAANEIGEIAVRGPNVTAGYRNNPEANRSSFIGKWFRTGDQGYVDDEGYVLLTGRLKELINRGGEKIAPREIDDVLLAHPAVAQAVAFGMPDRRLGEAVAAAVVLRDGATVTERQLREFLAMRLAFFKVPDRVLFLNELPKGPTGKLQRVGLADRLGLPGSAPEVASADGTIHADAPIERVAEIAADVLGVAVVDPTRCFLDLGGDSLLGTGLVARLNDAFGIDLSLLDLFDARSLATLASTIVDRILAELEGEAEDERAIDLRA